MSPQLETVSLGKTFSTPHSINYLLLSISSTPSRRQSPKFPASYLITCCLSPQRCILASSSHSHLLSWDTFFEVGLTELSYSFNPSHIVPPNSGITIFLTLYRQLYRTYYSCLITFQILHRQDAASSVNCERRLAIPTGVKMLRNKAVQKRSQDRRSQSRPPILTLLS